MPKQKTVSAIATRKQVGVSQHWFNFGDFVFVGLVFIGVLSQPMNLKCPKCNSEQLDQGVDSTILCHNCKAVFYLMSSWCGPDIGEDIEK